MHARIYGMHACLLPARGAGASASGADEMEVQVQVDKIVCTREKIRALWVELWSKKREEEAEAVSAVSGATFRDGTSAGEE